MKGGAPHSLPTYRRHLLETLFWVVARMLFRFRYKLVYEGVEHIPEHGAVLFLGNHVSWIDWLVVQFPIKRRIHFLMEREIYEWRLINPVMRLGKVIPISSRASKEGFTKARSHIMANEIVGMFPEGTISKTGELGKFYRGFELIGDALHGKIIPLYIDGLYGSVFSRSSRHQTAKREWFRRVITIRYGTPLPLGSDAEKVKRAVMHLKEANGT